ncbi:unnamed protein product [Rhizophagus irregularis]|nr:unnamed protein product [Rhizophagus irregularis]CAB5377535.1 unnamed protein product [Rhizophagus irregularis]
MRLQDRERCMIQKHGEKDDDTDLPADLPPDQKDLRYLPRNSILSRTCCESVREKRKNEQIVELKLKKKENVHMEGKIERRNVESRRKSYILEIKKRNNADKLKEKLKWKLLLKGERRWQHREETMATNREREAERDLDVREKQIRDRQIMDEKV